MFQKVGPARTSRDDRQIAAYLAFIAGAVNSAGFVVIGSFTSHVTGNVGRLADEIAVGNATLALTAGAAVITFFLGAFAASMLIESELLGSMSRTSAALLFFEATLIGVFVVSTQLSDHPSLHVAEMQATLLSAAMGIQNSLVTRLSGAIVRTTHLTGVVTDLGIEVARWFRYVRHRAGASRGWRFTLTTKPAPRPPSPKIALLATIFIAFVVGSACGAALAVRYNRFALVPFVVALLAGGVYALASGRSVMPPRQP